MTTSRLGIDNSRWQWNPLDAPCDGFSYSLAYTIATVLMSQLFGKEQ